MSNKKRITKMILPGKEVAFVVYKEQLIQMIRDYDILDEQFSKRVDEGSMAICADSKTCTLTINFKFRVEDDNG